MFHLVTTTFRALCDQQPTQIGYVSDEESLIHPDALSQIAAATKQLAASSLEERRTIDRAFEGLSAVAGRQLWYVQGARLLTRLMGNRVLASTCNVRCELASQAPTRNSMPQAARSLKHRLLSHRAFVPTPTCP